MIRRVALALSLALLSLPVWADESDAELGRALAACQREFAGYSVMCDAVVNGTCHYAYSLPACYGIEKLWNDGPAVRLREAAAKQREADRALIEKFAR